MVGGDDQPVRVAGRRPGDRLRRDRRPRRERLRGRSHRGTRLPAVHPLHAAGWSLGRPAAEKADPDRRRLRARGAARLDPDRVRGRRADARAALRRRLPRRRLPGVLRRRLPVVPAVARRARPDHRRQLEARDQPLRGAGRGARASAVASCQIFTAPYAVLVDAISFLGSGLFLLGIRKPEEPPARETVDGRKTSLWTELKEGLRFVLGNPNLRAQAGCTATSNFFSNVVFADLPRLPRARARAVGWRHRSHLLHRGARLVRSRVLRDAAVAIASASARRRSPSARSGRPRGSFSHSPRRETRPSFSSSSRSCCSAFRSSSTTSFRSATGRRSARRDCRGA